MQRSKPSHRLNTEEYEAYINVCAQADSNRVLFISVLVVYIQCVLARPQCWVVESNALYLRCLLEKSRHRTVERAMMQLQELVDCHSKHSPDVSIYA